jgi:HEAT repeat protein
MAATFARVALAMLADGSSKVFCLLPWTTKMSTNQHTELVALLSHKSSAKRRAAAKQLRKMKDSAAAPALLRALEEEVRDPRTWETQYHMVMAIAENGYAEALPFIRSLVTARLEPMVFTAVGDALVRLDVRISEDPARILNLLSSQLPVAEGALRAIAMLQLKLSRSAILGILEFASRPENEQVQFWVAAAAPGWNEPEVETFLHGCSGSKLADARKAAAAALQKRYLKWYPL